MADTIYITDTITQIVTMTVDMPSDKLLQERYFPTGTDDFYDSRKLLIDYDNGDRKSGAFLKEGYANGDTTTYFAQTVVPPRVACSDGIDTVNNDKDRLMFERFSKMQGNIRPTRADAMNMILRLKAARCADRNARAIERLCVLPLKDGAVSFTYATSPTDATLQTVDVLYYDPVKYPDGNPYKIVVEVAWGETGATPYKDVCKAAQLLKQHGGRTEDLLMSPDAWDELRKDMQTLGILNNQIYFTMIANDRDDRDRHFPEIEDYIEVIGTCIFDGIKLRILVYNGSYEDEKGVDQLYLGKMFACVLAPNCGRTLCGAVSKVNPKAVVDLEAEPVAPFTGKYVATRFVDIENDSVTVRVESVPLCIPNRVWSWVNIEQPEGDGEGGDGE